MVNTCNLLSHPSLVCACATLTRLTARDLGNGPDCAYPDRAAKPPKKRGRLRVGCLGGDAEVKPKRTWGLTGRFVPRSKSCAGLTALALVAGLGGPADAQERSWQYAVSIYGWASGIDTSVDTPLGTIGTELSFADVFDKLDFAFFGTFEARKGPWVVFGDLNYSDLSTALGEPVGANFADVETDPTLAVISGFVGYAVVDRPDLRIDAGAGFRYYDVSVDTQLVGNPGVPNVQIPHSKSWTDAIIGLHLYAPVSGRWFARAYVDVGGFGLGDSSELSWQVYAGGGYTINEVWAIEAGYRTLSIKQDFDNATVELDQSGPLIGVTMRF